MTDAFKISLRPLSVIPWIQLLPLLNQIRLVELFHISEISADILRSTGIVQSDVYSPYTLLTESFFFFCLCHNGIREQYTNITLSRTSITQIVKFRPSFILLKLNSTLFFGFFKLDLFTVFLSLLIL